ncbi:MAG: type I-C CRISPR-associated protein Cas8c/Csd1 [Candidatus Omnitrophica bacterium]|nr:type I-C CRISPR-associated protein Cas8c/Csd1 [Candidatus Omnitrophota bacterium]
MILQALNEQYERLKDNPNEHISLRGFSPEKIQFEFVLNSEGRLLQINDLRDENKAAKSLIVPEAVKRSVNIAANFLCDNTSYVLGRSSEEKEKEAKDPDRGKKTFEEFKKLHHVVGRGIEDVGMQAVLKFIGSWDPAALEQSLCWQKWTELGDAKIVFRLDGELGYIHERPTVKQVWLKYYDGKQSDYSAFCLVTGQKAGIARLHNSIKGVKDAQSTGADIVSCNLDAFKSYGKDQSYNSPISEEAMFNYTTALNHMLRKESRQKIQIGDATTVFWAEGETPVVGFLKNILDPRDDMPDLSGLRLFLEAVREGRKAELSGTENLRFYILGLAPNAKRLSVRFWHVSTVEEISQKIGQHFSDLSVHRNYEDESEYPGLWRLLIETLPKREGQKRKSEDISPLLAGALARSILTGSVYPLALLSKVLERIRLDGDISYLRVALIKAYLVRNNRLLKKNTKEVGMSLEKEQKNAGYLLGRLFAVLEKAQKDAVPGANTTIKDRFYGAASSTPSVVFPQLLRLAQHHIQKSSYGGLIEKNIEEITADVRVFPTHLSLEDQGMFALGYYHQKPEMYKKTEKKEEA